MLRSAYFQESDNWFAGQGSSSTPWKALTFSRLSPTFEFANSIKRAPEVKKQLWGGEFWTDGYYVGTVGRQGNEETIQRYVQQQGQAEEYKQLHVQQLHLFD